MFSYRFSVHSKYKAKFSKSDIVFIVSFTRIPWASGRVARTRPEGQASPGSDGSP